MNQSIVLAITGASGAVYAARLLESLMMADREVHLVVSESGTAVCRQELGVPLSFQANNLREFIAAARKLVTQDGGKSHAALGDDNAAKPPVEISDLSFERLHFYRTNDYFTPIASGSYLTSGMVICPCSGSTLSGIARSASENLIQRAAEVHLKERRKLIVVPRETPLSTFQLENMLRLSQAGVVVLPAAPGWYHGVHGLGDLVDFVVARILDQLGINNKHIERWAEKGSSLRADPV